MMRFSGVTGRIDEDAGVKLQTICGVSGDKNDVNLQTCGLFGVNVVTS